MYKETSYGKTQKSQWAGTYGSVGMSGLQTGGIILATMLGIAGFCMSVSALAMPKVPSFYGARRVAWLVAAASLVAGIALISWSAGGIA